MIKPISPMLVFDYFDRDINFMRTRILLAIVVSLLTGVSSVSAREFSLGTQTESKKVDAKAIDAPAPEIPSDYQDESFKSTITARFNIAADGKVKVDMLTGSGNEEIDKIVLTTLKKWKFQPATVDDEPVASTRKLKIELEVE
jgi:TonB family protein